MNKAPWNDSAGNEIHEGDTLQHPSGERGRVVFLAHESDPADQWRVNYGEPALSRLCLQIGDKGRAVVTHNMELAATRFSMPSKCDFDPYMSGCGFVVQSEGATKCQQSEACIRWAEIVDAN